MSQEIVVTSAYAAGGFERCEGTEEDGSPARTYWLVYESNGYSEDVLVWSEDDARLIATAPDLLAVLREVETVLTAMGDEDWPPKRLAPRLFRLRTLARSAIARTSIGTSATGEQA